MAKLIDFRLLESYKYSIKCIISIECYYNKLYSSLLLHIVYTQNIRGGGVRAESCTMLFKSIYKYFWMNGKQNIFSETDIDYITSQTKKIRLKYLLLKEAS